MRSLLMNFTISLIGSLVAWLLTLKLGNKLKTKSWPWHFLAFFVVFGIFFVELFILQEEYKQYKFATLVQKYNSLRMQKRSVDHPTPAQSPDGGTRR